MKYTGPAYKATQEKLTAKLLNNPHTALRREAQRNLGRMDGRAVRHAAGEQWWGPIGKKDPRLQAQKPLLDGGEGKSLDKTIVKNIADVTSGFCQRTPTWDWDKYLGKWGIRRGTTDLNLW
jgi:hypothetical protein